MFGLGMVGMGRGGGVSGRVFDESFTSKFCGHAIVQHNLNVRRRFSVAVSVGRRLLHKGGGGCVVRLHSLFGLGASAFDLFTHFLPGVEGGAELLARMKDGGGG